MNNYTKSILLLLLTIFIQLVVYSTFIKDYISTWGLKKDEQNLVLKGDDIAPYIISTRAITINSSKTEVWNILSQLGADRAGFYAYSFLEELLGYKTINKTLNIDHSMKVGRRIPSTIEKNEKYSFPIVEVEYQKYFVLKFWGTFFIKEISDNKFRLIVRSHGHTNNKSDIENLIFEPLHYIMERRMMLGIKAKSENDSIWEGIDLIWLFSIVSSAIGIFLMIFKFRNVMSIFVSIILSNIWLYCLLVFNPLWYSSLILLFSVCSLYFYYNACNCRVSKKDLGEFKSRRVFK